MMTKYTSAQLQTGLLDFILAGRARFTIVSQQTGARYTYRVSIPNDDPESKVRFVSVLVRPDNDTSPNAKIARTQKLRERIEKIRKELE